MKLRDRVGAADSDSPVAVADAVVSAEGCKEQSDLVATAEAGESSAEAVEPSAEAVEPFAVAVEPFAEAVEVLA